MLRTSRSRGGVSYVERWTNAKAGLIGFLTGRGYSSRAIADVLDDGTSPESVRSLQQKWSLHSAGYSGDEVMIVVPLSGQQRSRLHAWAMRRGMSIEEYARRILICSSMPTDMYDAIVPEGQFEDVT